jgi:hypothetical protein
MEILDYDNENVSNDILNNLEQRLNETNAPIVVKVFHPSCPHCTNMERDWNNAMDRLKNDYDGPSHSLNLHSGLLNNNIISHPHLQQSTINGLPTVRIIRLNDSPIEYEGDRSADDLFNFCVKNLDIKPKAKKPKAKAKPKTKQNDAIKLLKVLNKPKTQKALTALTNATEQPFPMQHPLQLPMHHPMQMPIPDNMSHGLDKTIASFIKKLEAKSKKTNTKAKKTNTKAKKTKAKKTNTKAKKTKAKAKKTKAKAKAKKTKAKAKLNKAVAKANKAKATATKARKALAKMK